MKAAVVHAFDRPLEIEDRTGRRRRGLRGVGGVTTMAADASAIGMEPEEI
jgi:hypothetical protein